MISTEQISPEVSANSSVGALWPPAEASDRRIKGIYTPGVISDEESLNAFMGEFIGRFDVLNSPDAEATRLSFRAVVNMGLLQKEASHLKPYIESILPLDGQFAGNALVYFGQNSTSRVSSLLDLERQRINIQEALHVPTDLSAALSKATSNGVQFRMLTTEQRRDSDTVGQVAELYARFNKSLSDVAEMLNNEGNLITVACIEGRIVSAVIGERAIIPVGSQTLQMVEVTEAATHKDFQRRGLYTGVSTMLLDYLAGNEDVDLVYGEINGLAPGALKAAKLQGRILACEVGGELGYPESGTLFQHVPIANGSRQTPYNDLWPAFITGQQLRRLYF